MINGVERFLKVKDNTNCTFTIIKGISYICKHNQQSHVCGMVVLETKLFFYLFLYICLESPTTYYTSVSLILLKIMGVEKLVYSYWKSLDLLLCTKVTPEQFLVHLETHLGCQCGSNIYKRIIKCISNRFLSFKILPLCENSDDNFEHFGLLITCLIMPQIFFMLFLFAKIKDW